MAVHIEGDADQSFIDINSEFLRHSNGVIRLHGSDISVTIKTNLPSYNLFLDLDSRSRLVIDSGVLIPSLHVHSRGGSSISVGENTSATGNVNLYSHETCEISIGKSCLIGPSFQCFASDMHSIIDVSNKTRVNRAEPITVEDDVWAGADVTILKGTRVGRGSIVGLRSTVAGEFPSHCLIAGYPARIIRSGVSWSADLLPSTEHSII